MTIIEEWHQIESHDHYDHRNHVWDEVDGIWRCKKCPMPVGPMRKKGMQYEKYLQMDCGLPQHQEDTRQVPRDCQKDWECQSCGGLCRDPKKLYSLV